MTRLGGKHDDGRVGVRLVRLETFQYLESIHAGHLQIEQDQVIAVLAVERTHFLRIHRCSDAGVASPGQQLLQQADVGLLIVDDQDARR